MDLARLELGLMSLKWTGTALLLGGVGVGAFGSLINRRSLAHRLGSRYVLDMHSRLRRLYIWRDASGIAVGQLGAALGLLSGFAFLGNRLFLFGAAVALVLPPLLIQSWCRKRRRQVDDQVNGFTLALSNALKTTASIGAALEASAAVIAKPLAQEVELTIKEMRLGSALDEALLGLSSRVGVKSLDVVISSLLIGRQMGGDLPRILEETAASLRETKRLEKMTLAVTQRAKFSLGIAALTTLLIALGLPLVLPNVYEPLFQSLSGKVILGQCAVAYLAALYLGYRVTRVDV
jgi:tight adherence protein B